MDRPSVTTWRSGDATAAVARASLTVGDVETFYRRVGSGAPVLLLGLAPSDEARVMSLLVEERRKVIVPDRTTLTGLVAEPGAEGSAFARWLSGFVQGLGLHEPAVVAAPVFQQELAGYESSSSDELGPVGFLPAGPVPDEAVVRLLAQVTRRES